MKDGFDLHEYGDILDLPRPLSARPRMSMVERGAQFSPFAALTGYEAAVEETARLTEDETVLTEDMKERLNERLLFLKERLNTPPCVTVTFFVPDQRKSGGETVKEQGRITHIDEYERTVTLSDHRIIPIDRIRNIEGKCFSEENFENE